jgi:cytochrome P450
LNEDGEGTHAPLSKATLVGEAMLALIGGSDTTATTLSNTLFYLMTHPVCMARLRRELDAVAGEQAAYDVEIGAEKLAGAKYLQAVINETLRLQPVAPSGVQRTPPKNGGPVLVAGQCVTVDSQRLNLY